MAFVKVASTEDLSVGDKIGAKTGDKEILIANLNGKYYAIGNKCTHRGCKLSEGMIEGENIKCPCHGSMFNIKTGKVTHGPAKNPEPTFKVKVEGNQILVEV